jgi:hypothetical protein
MKRKYARNKDLCEIDTAKTDTSRSHTTSVMTVLSLNSTARG